MARLNQRVEALEQMNGKDFSPWHWIVQRVGQTQEEAIALYEAANGSVSDSGCIIWKVKERA